MAGEFVRIVRLNRSAEDMMAEGLRYRHMPGLVDPDRDIPRELPDQANRSA